jgi:uncharacterized membrane protein
MVAGAVVLSLVMIQLDKANPHQNWVTSLGWTFSRGPEGSRAVLSTVAASMMTIASVTFSITIVALQLASSQFGPRLLRNFMRDRGNQVAIGTFIATFTYCLLVLRTVNGTESEQFVPHMSVTVGLLLALASVGVLIYFIHHSAESIQAENVIATVSNELRGAIDKLYPQQLGNNPSDDASELQLPATFEQDSVPIRSPRSDYLQAIDVNKLLKLAVDNNCLFSVDVRPGKFCFEGDLLVRAWPPDQINDKVTKEVCDGFYFGSRRTLSQDVEFAIDQLVEIAVRALSPGINDPNTAINCVDRLGAALCTLSNRDFPSRFRHDDAGHLRVVTDVSTIAGIVDAAFDQIRQASRENASVTIRLLETLRAVAGHVCNEDFRGALRRQAEAVHRGSQDGIKEQSDRNVVEQRYQDVITVLSEEQHNSKE